MHGEMLIDGHFIGGPCDQRVPKAVVRSPFDGRVVGTAAEGDESALMTAISAADEAFQTWQHSTATERSAILRRASDLIRARRSELAALLVDEIGKPIVLAEAEVDRMAITFGLAADLAGNAKPERLSLDFDPRGSSYTCEVERFPIGPILAIVPYNWPYNLTAHKVAPALATGNTVVVKPSPQALLSTYALGRMLHECGAPPGVVNVVDAPIPAVQRACQDPRIKMVSFTGSDSVGWPLKAALPAETRCVLELGGDATAIVCADADIEWAVERLTLGAFGYAGQICISLQHALMHESIFARACERLAAAAKACPTGDPKLRETLCGPLISSTAADRVESWIQEAAAGGAQRLADGERRGNIVPPCVLVDVPDSTRVATKEIFGPVLTVDRFRTVDEAIERVNGSRYGLQASVFTRDLAIEEQCYRAIMTGAVIANDHPAIRFDNYPYGGEKFSGFGREGVEAAMGEMSSTRARV